MPLEPLIVEALFSFKGTNNDELCFKKGDLITVTQKDDEWWEGTFNDKTGWFPGNYVKERKDVLTTIVSQQNEYKGVVLNDLIDSEKAFVTEIEGLITNFLLPLEKTSILTLNEYKQLIGNITEIFETHQQLLKLVILENTKPGSDQRVGQLFLNWAQKIKLVHQAYCSMHPRAACIIDRFKDELNKYMESKGASCPGVLVLTTLLSKPFRRLEKYSGLLQELERHVEEFHSDRGDTQRSVEIYKDIASVCSATRRQKELELQVLTGPIRNWDNQSLSVLGDIICMSSVAVGPQHNDRYFVLFSSCLVILSVSQRLSAFIYEGELPLSGLNVARLDDSDSYKNAFEISSGSAEKKIVVCQSKEEANQWVELLKKNMMRNSNVSEISQKEHSSQTMFVPQPPPHMPPIIPVQNMSELQKNQNKNSTTLLSHANKLSNIRDGWSASCIRPSPPLRICLDHSRNSSPSGVFGRSQYKTTSYDEDNLILDVINAYCVVNLRNTVNSVNLTNKLDSNKNVTETIQILQNKLNNVECNVASLSTILQQERASRYQLQSIVKKHVCGKYKDFEWPNADPSA